MSPVEEELEILEEVKAEGKDSLVDNILYSILKFRKEKERYPNKIIVHGDKDTFIEELNKTISAIDESQLFQFDTEYNEESDENKVEFAWEPDEDEESE